VNEAEFRLLDQIEEDHWWFVGKRMILRALLCDLATGSRILDLGCGTGGILRDWMDRSVCVGVDRSSLALQICARRGFSTLARADLTRLPFREGSFDVLLLMDVIEHLDDDVEFLRAASRLVEEGAQVVVAVPAFSLLGETRTLEVLLPEIDAALHRDESLVDVYFGVLGEFDRRVAAGETLSNAVVLTSILLPLTPWPGGQGQRGFTEVRAAVLELLDGVLQRLRVSRKDSEAVRQLMLSIRKMAPGFQARRFSRTVLSRRPYFRELLTVFSIHCRARRCWTEALQDWEDRLPPAERTPARQPSSGPAGVRREGNGRRRRRRGGGSRRTPVGSRSPRTHSDKSGS